MIKFIEYLDPFQQLHFATFILDKLPFISYFH